MRFVSFLAFAAGLTASAAAASADKTFSITGAGGVACSQITADIASKPEASAQIVSWIQGYATAINRTTDDTWELMGAGGIDATFKAVQDYCAAHADTPFETAVFDTLNAGYANRLKSKP